MTFTELDEAIENYLKEKSRDTRYLYSDDNHWQALHAFKAFCFPSETKYQCNLAEIDEAEKRIRRLREEMLSTTGEKA